MWMIWMILQLNIRFLMLTGQSQVYSYHADDSIAKVKDLLWAYWPTGEPASPDHLTAPLR